ncbi:hypothetical protein IE077_002973 [Cardiosporidium cionae]|uniref:Uncharacterized protein n=1 Tax=Cardiosporidium cionae TaxID=476202 RepID=A0ABQ7J9G5_9APIC|nr:hypothetical protein IE077_002973 [Cardiosporidium cionae]|eukprot:KAF8820640.1 hypothetical protein IE077_002973 [Cardiosporidium cionae]
MEEEKQLLHTFQPQISLGSRRLMQRRREQNTLECLPVERRLLEKDRMKKQNKTYAALTEKYYANSNEPNYSNSEKRKDVNNFISRMEIFQLGRDRRLQILHDQLDADMTFKPTLPESTEKLLNAHPDRLCETPEERLERLAITVRRKSTE